jgi:hypothetical protein
MAILIFLLSLALLVVGVAAAYMSLDLLPTGPGLLYALSGAAAAAMAIVTFALGVLVWRVDKLAALVRQSGAAYGAPTDGPSPTAPPPLEPEAPTRLAEAEGAEAPINENRAGHLPTFAGVEAAVEAPEAQPRLIGRYSAGGANYMIFADGSIEAETKEGTFKFASMTEFKHFLAERRNARAGGDH